MMDKALDANASQLRRALRDSVKLAKDWSRLDVVRDELGSRGFRVAVSLLYPCEPRYC